MDDLSLQQLLVTNFGLSPSGYTGSVGAVGATGPAGGYTGSAGSVGYVGSAGAGVVMTVDTFTGDGSTTAFVLSTTPESINRTTVNYNGATVLRSAYTLSQATVTFSSAPAVGSQLEITTINSAAGSGSSGTALKVSTVGYVGNNTATDTAGGETVSLTGTGFVTGASVIVNGVAAGVVTVISATQLTFTAPAMAAGTYIFYVVNTDGATAISVPGISYSGVPSFYVGAGSVGTVYEASSFNSNVSAVGDSAITYTIASGSLPSGATLNANGVITGSSVLTASPTTYTFGVNASDGQNQDVVRSYTITVNPDTVAWLSPANGATVSLGQGSSSTTTLTAVSAAGSSVTYTANALPTGLSIVGSAVTGTPTVLGNTTTVLTANATSTTRTANITVTWNIAVTSEPYFMYNSLLLPGNGTNGEQNNTFLDGSTNNFAITRAGNTTQGTYSPYGPNWSNYFDGTGDTISVPSVANLVLSTGNFTVECWINPGSQPGAYNTIIGGDTSGSLLLSILGGGTSTSIGINAYGSGGVYSQSYTFTQGVWYHIAATRSGTSLKVFINGTQLGSTVTDGTDYSAATRIIGGIGGGGQNYSGYVSNARIVKGTAVYTSNFTPSTTPLTAIANTSLLTCQSNRFIDTSSNAYTVTKGGDVSVQRFSPFSPTAAYSAGTIGGSGYFDGSGDYLTAANNSAFNLNGVSFTVECWIYWNSVTGEQNIVEQFSAPSGPGWTLYKFNSSTGSPAGSVDFYGGSTGLNSGLVPVAGQWYHLAISRDNSTGAASFYVNGTRTANATFSVGSTAATSLLVGVRAGGSTWFNGYMEDLRIVKGSYVYNPTATTITVPTAPVSAVANTQLLLGFTNAGIIDNTMINNLETVGNAQISTAQTKFGSGSMSFDGNGDYCFLPRTSSFLFSSGDFTIELWTYIGNTTDRKYILGPGTDTASHYKGFGLEIWGQQLCMWASSTGSSWNMLECDTSSNRGSTLMAANTWYNITVTRSGNTFRSFVNGVVEKTFTVAGTIYSDPTIPYNIGRVAYQGGGFYYNGYMDDLRITLGYARYTTTFTPPTSAFSQK